MLHELNTIFCPALQDLYVTLLHFWLVLYDVDSIYWPMLHDLYAVFLYALYDLDSGIDKFYINHNPSIVKPAITRLCGLGTGTGRGDTPWKDV